MSRMLLTALMLLNVFTMAPSLSADDAPGDASSPTKKATEIAEEAKTAAEDIAEKVDQNEQAQEVAANVLNPIYQIAEYCAFSGFYWVAFAVMATGVVSYSLQLVLAKLVVLAKFGFSLTEILSDALGLVISLTGLVLTTQAASENSSFAQSPAMVLSATAVGVVAGFVFYWFGQAAEVEAVEGRKQKAKQNDK